MRWKRERIPGKAENMEEFDFTYCPNPNCRVRLSSDWKCYEVGRIEEGVFYKCPYCGVHWSADSMLVNALEIPEEAVERKSRVVIIGEGEGRGKVVGEFQAEQVFKVKIRGADRFFLHIPTKMVCRGQKAFLVPPSLSNEDFLKGLEGKTAWVTVSEGRWK